nr:immunoglobulin light chain junction region [Macaca mulatta]MOX33000.1 immunoglobulin light chain junction region [Macaca mulatta]
DYYCSIWHTNAYLF